MCLTKMSRKKLKVGIDIGGRVVGVGWGGGGCYVTVASSSLYLTFHRNFLLGHVTLP